MKTHYLTTKIFEKMAAKGFIFKILEDNLTIFYLYILGIESKIDK